VGGRGGPLAGGEGAALGLELAEGAALAEEGAAERLFPFAEGAALADSAAGGGAAGDGAAAAAVAPADQAVCRPSGLAVSLSASAAVRLQNY
jgi:hypothetical protein